MRRAVILSLALSAACAHTKDKWGDDDYVAGTPKKDAPKADTNGPPVSFVVASNEDGEGTGDALDRVRNDPNAKKVEEETTSKTEDAPPPATAEKKGREIPVIVEKAPPDKLATLEQREAALGKTLPAKVEPPLKGKKGKTGESSIPVVIEQAPEKKKAASDPFQKLDREMADLEKAGSKPPPSSVEKDEKVEKQKPAAVARVQEEEEEIVQPAPPPPKKKSTRDPNRIGLSILAGGGVLASNGVIPGYGYHLAYGGQVAWNPAFAGDFALDVGFWRTGKSGTTGFTSVDTADNHASVRIMFLPTIVAGFYLGVGVGGVATYTQAHYRLGTALPSEVDAGAFRVGGDGTVALGYRFWHVEARIDLRTLYLQGNRLEFLPTGSIGATF